MDRVIILRLITGEEVIGAIYDDPLINFDRMFLTNPAFIIWNEDTQEHYFEPFSANADLSVPIPINKNMVMSPMLPTQEVIDFYIDYLDELGLIDHENEDEIDEAINKESKTKKETLH